MLFYYFKLDDYFLSTKKHFYFIDGLFRTCERTKKDVFDELKIPDSTYRTNRLKDKARNSWTYMPIIKYFEYNNIDYSRQREYEDCLAKVYHNVYFKNVDSLKELSQILEKYIAEHNILKPVFILFKTLCEITIESLYDKQKSIIEENLTYLDNFRKKYFTPDIEFIYLCLCFYVGRNTSGTSLENFIHSNSKLLWYYYFLSGTYYYLKRKDYEALTNYERAASMLLDDFNIDRYAMIMNNIAFIYNNSGRFALGLENSSKLVKYAFSSETANKYCIYSVNHYIFAAYMLNQYAELVEIFDFMNNVNAHNHIGDVYIIMAMVSYAKQKRHNYPSFIQDRMKENSILISFAELLKSKQIKATFIDELSFECQYWTFVRKKLKVDILKL